MYRQYHATRHQGGENPFGIGVIPVGAIFYLQNNAWWRDRFRGRPSCRNPWIVESVLNGIMAAARRNQITGLWEDAHLSRRSETAVVRSLRDGGRSVVSIRLLIRHEEEGLRRDPATYPDLPCLARHRRAPAPHLAGIQQSCKRESEHVPVRWFPFARCSASMRI